LGWGTLSHTQTNARHLKLDLAHIGPRAADIDTAIKGHANSIQSRPLIHMVRPSDGRSRLIAEIPEIFLRFERGPDIKFHAHFIGWVVLDVHANPRTMPHDIGKEIVHRIRVAAMGSDSFVDIGLQFIAAQLFDRGVGVFFGNQRVVITEGDQDRLIAVDEGNALLEVFGIEIALHDGQGSEDIRMPESGE